MRILLSIAAILDLEIEGWDIATAFLHPYLKSDEIIYMRSPHGVPETIMPKIVKLSKCMYGLPQASAYFKKHLDDNLIKLGFTQLQSDSCVFIKRVDDDFIIISTHVDDMGVISNSNKLKEEVKYNLQKIYGITIDSNFTNYLGLYIQRDRIKRTIFLSQPEYISNMMEKFNIVPIDNPPLTPMVTESLTDLLNRHKNESDINRLLSPKDITLYQSKIGSLLYLAMQTRPDIYYSVIILAKFAKNPTIENMKQVNRVLNYINNTRELGLLFYSLDTLLKFFAKVDVSHATHLDMKSHTGYNSHFGQTGGSVSFISEKQTTPEDNTAWAEYGGVHRASKIIMWMRNFCEELGFVQVEPTTVYEDNQSTIQLLENPNNSIKSRPVQLKYNTVKHLIKNKQISMKYLRTEDMTADMLTKALGPTQFIHLRKSLLGYIPIPNEDETL